VFKTRDVREIGFFATTLLASVERCSRCRTHWAATAAGSEHGSTLASSVVAEEEELAGRPRRLVLNMAPRWQAAWWPKRKNSRGSHDGWF